MHKLDYYEVLGLTPNATAADIEASYLAISQFLDPNNVPHNLRAWATSRAALADEAYAALVGAGDDEEEAARATTRQPRAARAAPRKASVVTRQARPRDYEDDLEDEDYEDDRYTEAEDDFSEDYEEDDEEIRRPVGANRRGRVPATAAKSGVKTVDKPRWEEGRKRRARGRPVPPAYRRPVPRGDDRTRRILIGVGAGIVVLLIAYLAAVQMRLGPFGGSGLDEGQANQPIPINQARYSQLVAVANSDPLNFDAVFELGEMTFEAEKFSESITWLQKALTIKPNDVQSLLDVGTANFNLGNRDKVLEPWQKALAIDPDNPQTHWNLGFYYASNQPPDIDLARQEWQKVVQLTRPGDQLYKLAQTHLEQYK